MLRRKDERYLRLKLEKLKLEMFFKWKVRHLLKSKEEMKKELDHIISNLEKKLEKS